jgi:hypothetical protein
MEFDFSSSRRIATRFSSFRQKAAFCVVVQSYRRAGQADNAGPPPAGVELRIITKLETASIDETVIPQ